MQNSLEDGIPMESSYEQLDPLHKTSLSNIDIKHKLAKIGKLGKSYKMLNSGYAGYK